MINELRNIEIIPHRFPPPETINFSVSWRRRDQEFPPINSLSYDEILFLFNEYTNQMIVFLVPGWDKTEMMMYTHWAKMRRIILL